MSTKNIFKIIFLLLLSNRSFSQDTIKRIDKQTIEEIQKIGTWQKPQVFIKKHWISDAGDYLFMYTNIYNPHGYYALNYDTDEQQTVSFFGSQKGDEIKFKGFNPESDYRPIMEFSGVLDTNNFLIGTWAEITENGNSGFLKKVIFSPINNLRPINYKIKTYVSEIEYEVHVSKIKIVFDTLGKEQILENFIARPFTNELLLEDLNFDGYLDISILYDLPMESDREEYHIFWFYNPTTQQFEPSNFLNQSKIMDTSADAQKKRLIVSPIRENNFNQKYFNVKFENGKAVRLVEVE